MWGAVSPPIYGTPMGGGLWHWVYHITRIPTDNSIELIYTYICILRRLDGWKDARMDGYIR